MVGVYGYGRHSEEYPESEVMFDLCSDPTMVLSGELEISLVECLL